MNKKQEIIDISTIEMPQDLQRVTESFRIGNQTMEQLISKYNIKVTPQEDNKNKQTN